MRPKLYPYQVAGAEFLAERQRALLFDVMGLGKSAQAIAAADLEGLRRILVICPAIARINWQREFKKFSEIERRSQVVLTRNDVLLEDGVVIISYDLVAAQLQRIHAIRWQLCILDEGHYLKNPDAKRTAAVYGRRCAALDGVIAHASRVWVLTGTPAPNDNSELYSHLRALFPERLAEQRLPLSFPQFQGAVCHMRETLYGWKPFANRPEGVKALREVLKPVMLRRRYKDVLHDLPPISYSTVRLSPAKALLDLKLEGQDETVQGIARVIEAAGEGSGIDAVGIDSISRLARLTGMAKADATADMLEEELEGGLDKVVVFAHHLDVINLIETRLARFQPAAIDGRTTPRKRQARIDAFQDDPATRVFIGQLNAASTAITLTAANQVVFAEWSWTPAVNEQAAKRCHRIGQTRPVFARFISLAGSVDEIVTEVVARKTRQVAELLDNPTQEA